MDRALPETGIPQNAFPSEDPVDYGLLRDQVCEIIREDPWYVAALSNISSLIFQSLPGLNWAGFYLLRGGRLTVGPFQGRPACIHIDAGRGVCGAALEKDEVLNVPDVHLFPGHIACDSASNSEIVLPIHFRGRAAAVLDLDSPFLSRFTEDDQKGLKMVTEAIEAGLSWTD